MMNVLIIGATSAIAHETAKHFAAQSAHLFLVARDADKVKSIAADLKTRGASQVDDYLVDLADLSQHQVLLEYARQQLGQIDYVLIAHGILGDQRQSQADWDTTLKEFNLNAVSYISLLTILANYLEQQRRGTIAVVSSVAGERGRGSNYVYGAAKAAVTAFTSGLRARLSKAGVNVLTVKPGFVDTPMTAHLKKNPLFADAGTVGKQIHTAMLKGTDVAYTPWFWQPIMLLIRNIPERVFKKLPL